MGRLPKQSGSLADPREQLFVAPMSDGAPVEPERWVAITELKYFDANPIVFTGR